MNQPNTTGQKIHALSISDSLASRETLKIAIAGLVMLLIAAIVGWLGSNSWAEIGHRYLLLVCFFLSISLGALFFVILQHLTRSRWSVVTRRVAELLCTVIPLYGVLLLPILLPMLFGSSHVYRWNDAALRVSDTLIRGKATYLNSPFFVLRCLVYFGLWSWMARFFLTQSTHQDVSHSVDCTRAMRKWSGPAMIAFSLSINFAAFDLLMSLDPHWFSAIFGIYYFSGSIVAFLAALPLCTAMLQRRGYLRTAVTTEHYHDIAKLLFGFVCFWAYIAFSQYLLIWYANIPEETIWFLHRQQGGWHWFGLALIVGHFALPFFGLMSRASRRSLPNLLCWSCWILVMHFIDLSWVVMPNVSQQFVTPGLFELSCFLGISALSLAVVLRRADGIQLVATGDPYFSDSVAFHNI